MPRARALTAVLFALVAAAVALPSPAAAADACTARGARVVLENDQARVFYVRGRGELVRTWYGCVRGSRPSVLARDLSPRSDEVTHTQNTLFRLAGPSVAWVQTSSSDFGAGEFGRAVLGRSLRRGGGSFSQDVTDLGDIEALAVRADGATAWVGAAGSDHHEIDLHVGSAKASTALAYARDIDPASLSIDDAGVHWTQAGTAHTAPVRPQPEGGPSPTAAPGAQTLDPRYGSCGVLQPPLPQRVGAAARAIARGPDGSVAVAGGASFGRAWGSIMLSRLRPDA